MDVPVQPRRLFLALWPDAAACAALQTLGQDWHWPPGAARYQPADWHVTLHFLGAVAQPTLTALVPAVGQAFEPFELTLEQPQAWPRGLVVLCPGQVPPPLLDLQQRLGHRLAACGVPVEARAYRPHLTLARRAVLALPPQVLPVSWRVSSYFLVESTGDPHKRYRPLVQYTAAGGGQVLAPDVAPELGP